MVIERLRSLKWLKERYGTPEERYGTPKDARETVFERTETGRARNTPGHETKMYLHCNLFQLLKVDRK